MLIEKKNHFSIPVETTIKNAFKLQGFKYRKTLGARQKCLYTKNKNPTIRLI